MFTFAIPIHPIISGCIVEHARIYPWLAGAALLVGLAYLLFEGVVWCPHFDRQASLEATLSAGSLMPPDQA
jgi:Amt family ammonium transporter